MTPNMRLIDVNGAPHVLTAHQVRMMITIGWVTFLAAWLMNFKFSLSPKGKMFIYIFGKKYNLLSIRYNLSAICRSGCCSKGEFTLLIFYQLNCTIFSIPRQKGIRRRYCSGS